MIDLMRPRKVRKLRIIGLTVFLVLAVLAPDALAAPPNLTVNNATVTVDEGQTASNSGTFSDSDSASVTITASVGTITQDTGSSGNWSWSFDTIDGPADSQTVTITATDSDGEATTTTFELVVNNVAPVVTLDPVSAIVENGTATLSGTITDPGILDTFTLDINWGDPKSPNNVEQYTYGASATGEQTFTLTHQFLDDNPSGTLWDIYSINVTVTDNDGGSGSNGTTVRVNNVAPNLSNVVVAPPEIDENDMVLLTGDIIDPSTLDTFTLVVNWGDGSPSQTFTYPAGTNAFSMLHTYRDDKGGTALDSYTISLTLTDDDSGVDTGSASVTVNNVAPQLENVDVTSPIDENDTATLTGDIVDPGTLDTFTLIVDWGDGSAPETFNYPAGTTGFDETHQYLDDDPSGTSSDIYPISLTLTDDDGGTGTASTSITVDNVAPQLENVVVTSEIDEDGTVTLTGDIVDPGTLDTFTLYIDWGDPLSPNNVESNPFGASAAGTQPFTLTHQYLDDNPSGTSSDIYTINLTVIDDDNGSGADSVPVQVNNLPPTVDADPDKSVLAGDTVFLTSVVFTDTGTLDTHTAIIDWGDGPPQPGTVNESDGSGTVTSDGHVYLTGGSYTVVVTVTDDDGGQGQATLTVLVTEADLAISKDVDNRMPAEGEHIVYTLQVTNLGPYDATGVVVTDILPSGVTYVSDDGGGAYNSVTGDWDVGGLSALDSTSLNITAEVDAGTLGQVITNIAAITASDQTDWITDNDQDEVSINQSKNFLPIILNDYTP